MEQITHSFGEFLTNLRKNRKMPMRILAYRIGVSAQYLSEVEKGRKAPLTQEKIKIAAEVLDLTEEEKEELYDLAARDRAGSGQVSAPQDCIDYLAQNPQAVRALRLAKRTNAGEEEWNILIRELEKRL